MFEIAEAYERRRGRSSKILAPLFVENWRAGRIPYLEQVTKCKLAKTSRILRIDPLRFTSMT